MAQGDNMQIAALAPQPGYLQSVADAEVRGGGHRCSPEPHRHPDKFHQRAARAARAAICLRQCGNRNCGGTGEGGY